MNHLPGNFGNVNALVSVICNDSLKNLIMYELLSYHNFRMTIADDLGYQIFVPFMTFTWRISPMNSKD